jgi:hypothetical protein
MQTNEHEGWFATMHTYNTRATTITQQYADTKHNMVLVPQGSSKLDQSFLKRLKKRLFKQNLVMEFRKFLTILRHTELHFILGEELPLSYILLKSHLLSYFYLDIKVKGEKELTSLAPGRVSLKTGVRQSQRREEGETD